MFSWETGKAHQSSLLEVFPEVLNNVAPASHRLINAFGDGTPEQNSEDRHPGEPNPAEQKETAMPEANFVADPKANQDFQYADPQPREPEPNFAAISKTPNAKSMPHMPKCSQSLPRTTGRKTLSTQADEEKIKGKKTPWGGHPSFLGTTAEYTFRGETMKFAQVSVERNKNGSGDRNRRHNVNRGNLQVLGAKTRIPR